MENNSGPQPKADMNLKKTLNSQCVEGEERWEERGEDGVEKKIGSVKKKKTITTSLFIRAETIRNYIKKRARDPEKRQTASPMGILKNSPHRCQGNNRK